MESWNQNLNIRHMIYNRMTQQKHIIFPNLANRHFFQPTDLAIDLFPYLHSDWQPVTQWFKIQATYQPLERQLSPREAGIDRVG